MLTRCHFSRSVTTNLPSFSSIASLYVDSLPESYRPYIVTKNDWNVSTTDAHPTSPRQFLGSRRRYSTKASAPGTSKSTSSDSSESIFSSSESPWDHVFSGIKDMPPLLPSAVRNPLRSPGTEPSNPQSRTRRQAMTAREISAFDEMFNMIFNAVSEQKRSGGPGINGDPLSDVGIGRGPEGSQMSDLFGKLRRHSKKLKWTSESDELLDRKKEEMDLCDTDQQLLEWAMREVFGESKRYEEAARKAILEASSGKEPETMPMLQPSTYPHLIAHLMRAFRDKYHDPHLALSIFDHARHLSIPSYVFGCTTPAYNELIETRWTCFRDLKGVHDALEEMMVNGVEPDSRTRKLVEALRREVGERNLWQEETELGSGEVWAMLSKIEALVLQRSGVKSMKKTLQGLSGSMAKSKRPKHQGEAWKNAALHPEQSKDGWEFGRWDDKRSRGSDVRRDQREDGFHF